METPQISLAHEKEEILENVFFTYVWGDPGEPAWPLTFSTKAARAHAKTALTEGDLVFTVGTKREPTMPQHRGRVLGVYMVSDLEVNTQDYRGGRTESTADKEGLERFPFALHPIAVWEISTPSNLFSELVGPLTPNHHLQAQSKIVELEPATSQPLLALERRQVALELPKTQFGQGLIALKASKLAPKHQGMFESSFSHHDIWFLYVLVLRDAQKKELAFKVGYSHDPEIRAASYNAPLAREVTGLFWTVYLKQPTHSEDAARQIEQALLERHATKRLGSNGEIISGVNGNSIAAAIAEIMRKAIAS